MKFPRSCGTLLHPTSLPSGYGMGDFGPAAKHFIDFLHQTGQTIWQVLPLGPTGFGFSPYTSFSAFAGNPYLISPDLLAEKGLLSPEEIRQAELPLTTTADYEKAHQFKNNLFKTASDRFFDAGGDSQNNFEEFKNKNAFWLKDYCRFAAASKANQKKTWNHWPQDLAQRGEQAVKNLETDYKTEIDCQTWLQFEFHSQWFALKKYANDRNIRIIGDLPIFVDHNSADVWSNPRFFELDEKGNPERVAGVPPDYFSKTGQLWGNPLYNWSLLEEDGFSWWVERFRQVFRLFDAIRVDHFRGFDEYWEVSASEKTAENGRWVKAPGRELFQTIIETFPEVPVIAEDLGVITPGVSELRNHFGFPGMKVLQFAFHSGPANEFLPHNYTQNCVVYTGTHDNDTTSGWYHSAPEPERHRARVYTKSDGNNMPLELIRLGMLSVADQAIFPLQDFMNLGTEHRMNMPGTVGRNWLWRYTPEMLDRLNRREIKNLISFGNRL